MKALLIVDIQNDFLSGGSLSVPEGNEIITQINAIQPFFDFIIASQDWHPANHKSFASNHPKNQPFDVIDWRGAKQVLWPNHCVQGTYGAQFSDQLQTNPISAIIRKGMNPEIDSYSVFFDNDQKNSTGLLGLLRELKCTDVYVCGLAADFCVYYSALDAVKNGFSTFFVEDASKPISREGYQKAKKDLLAREVTFVSVQEILNGK